MVDGTADEGRVTVGIDLGDRLSRYCFLDPQGDVVDQGSIPTTEVGISHRFRSLVVSVERHARECLVVYFHCAPSFAAAAAAAAAAATATAADHPPPPPLLLTTTKHNHAP